MFGYRLYASSLSSTVRLRTLPAQTQLESEPEKMESWGKAVKNAMKENDAQINFRLPLEKLESEFQEFMRQRQKQSAPAAEAFGRSRLPR